MLSALTDMEAEVSSYGTAARGLLRVAAPMDFGWRRIAPALAGFARAHPEPSIQLVSSDTGAEIGEDLLGVAIRTGLPANQNEADCLTKSPRPSLAAVASYGASSTTRRAELRTALLKR